MNIHSHLFGALLFCWLLVFLDQTYLASYPTVTWKDAAVFSIFLVSAVICMFLSAFYHTCGVHSEGVRSTAVQTPNLFAHERRRSRHAAMSSTILGS